MIFWGWLIPAVLAGWVLAFIMLLIIEERK